jgi:hypothetical protein
MRIRRNQKRPLPKPHSLRLVPSVAGEDFGGDRNGGSRTRLPAEQGPARFILEDASAARLFQGRHLGHHLGAG